MEKKLQLRKGNSYKIKATFAFVVSILFFGTSNEAFSQAATATWNLTSNGNGSVTGAVTATSLAIGSSISNASYGNTNGVTTDSWTNDGSSLNSNEYYEYEVTPTAGNKLTISSVTLNHSISNGNWLAAVYYSYNGFSTAGVQIGSNFTSSSSSQTALNLTGLSLVVPSGGSFSIRVYAWESDGSNRNFRNRNVVITGTTCVLPAITTQPVTQGVCIGGTLNLSVTATNATSYQWKKGGVNIGGATSSSYSISNFAAGDAASYTVDVINSCQTVTSNAAVITANATPTAITIAPTNPTVCSNAITTLTASGGVAAGVTILNENFNSATNNWTLENTSTGGTVADAAWKLRPNSYGYDVDVFNSNDNSQFYLSNSDDQGTGSTTSTRLISPVIDLSNCTAATLSFYHYYRSASGDTAKVQISTNGGATWSSTDLASYATLQGVDNAFAFVSISLNSFVGNNNIKIRFNYSASWDWYWAIDNVSITASKPQITWTPQVGLYTDALANTPYTGQITSIVYAKLTSNSSFTATSTSSEGCTSSNIVAITVNPNVTPTFTAVAPICSGGSLSALPTTSNNGITGTWSPALSNTVTNTYTFTPTSGQCATTTTLTITVNPNVTPTFTAVAPICSGGSLSALPTTSNNGITGTWSPALSNTATNTYTFTPTSGQCATTTTLTITVNPNVTPTFTAVAPICSGGSLSALPTTSNNGITGTWSPALSNTATNTYTFTPTSGQCATTTTLTITVNPNVTPTFTAVAPICSGGSLSALPTTSNNGITGTWSPALSNTATNTYTFTPTSGQCATTTTLTITVNPNVTPTFTAVAPICSGGSLSALPTTSNNGITGTWSPALSNTASNTYTFTPTSGQCATSTTLTITVNPNVTYYRDFDTDGFGDLSITQISCTGAPIGFVANSTDCDDTNNLIYQSALLYTDVDGDGYNVGSAVTCYGASLPAGTSLTTIAFGDCDDNNNLVYQSALLYTDVDGDGYNVGSAVTCYGASLPAGTSLTTIAFGDCNDNNNLVYQSALLYTDVDGDGYNVGSAITCYGATLPAGTSLTTIGSGDCNDNNNLVYQTGVFYVDFDGDNYATSNTTISLCYGASEPNGYSAVNLGIDCDDTNSAIFQTGLFYVDADGDNYSTGNSTTSLCYGALEPNGYSAVNLGLDCDDTNGSIFQTGLFYVDADADNYSTGTTTISLCYGASEPNGYSAINLGIDCDDTIAAINPGQAEILYNGFDDNCDGTLDEGFQITTPMMGCGSTITVINSLISAVSSPAIGITGYRFEVTKLGSSPLEVQVIDRPIQYFSLTQLSKYSYAATYSIRCMLQRNGVWLGYYGPACNISSPAVLDPGGASSITPSQCGITLPTINTLIATTSLAGATGYKFKVTNTRTGFVQELTRTLQWFSLTMLAQYVYGDTYTVEVAVKTTGDYTGYGSPCEVTAPVVPSLISQCNTIIAAKTTNVATSSLAYVSSYDFEVRNMTTLATANVSNNLNWFRLNMLTNYAPNTQFRVRVRLLSSGVYSDYGDACFITSPAFARTQEVVVDENIFEVTASPNPFDTNFGMFLNATSTEDVSIRVYDMIGKLMEQRLVKATEVVTQEVGNNYSSGVYNVIVSQGAEVKTLRMIKR